MIKFKIYHKPLPLSKVNKHQNHCEALFNCTIQNIALNYSIKLFSPSLTKIFFGNHVYKVLYV